MGAYVYKVIGKTVDLDNGAKANVALYAYKPSRFHPDAHRWHTTSGAAACDRNVEKRTGWIVYGHKDDDGTIAVDREAFTVGSKFGSFVDYGMDDLIGRRSAEGRYATAGVVKVGRGIRIAAE